MTRKLKSRFAPLSIKDVQTSSLLFPKVTFCLADGVKAEVELNDYQVLQILNQALEAELVQRVEEDL